MSPARGPESPEPGPTAAPRKVTRADVARHAGVSDAVVSYTLNGGPPVAAATRARVLESVRVLGYTPNAAARALRLGSSRLLGVIVPDSTNPFWAELCHAVETVADGRGYGVLVVNAHDRSGETARHLAALASRQVDGVLIATSISAADVPVYDAAGVSWAALNPSEPVSGVPGVGIDLVDGARRATEHLVRVHGHRRIAFVGPDRGETTLGAGRLDGWLAALDEAGLPRGPVFSSAFTRRAGYDAGRSVAAVHDSVDAVFASSDMIAMGVMRALHEAGLRIPEDVAVVGFDGSPESEYSWPALTTLQQPVQELAARAVEHLLRRGAGGHAEPAPLRGELVVRASCGCSAVAGRGA